jgi:hypothetical protein
MHAQLSAGTAAVVRYYSSTTHCEPASSFAQQGWLSFTLLDPICFVFQALLVSGAGTCRRKTVTVSGEVCCLLQLLRSSQLLGLALPCRLLECVRQCGEWC